MFETSLKDKIKRIFDMDKVTYDRPSDSKEQECAFIEVETARCSLKDAVQVARVQGKIHFFANQDKMPYGYISKKIAEAALDDVKNLFFFDMEENVGVFRNICERSLSFIYLFDSQYDPAIGTLNQLELEYSGG